MKMFYCQSIKLKGNSIKLKGNNLMTAEQITDVIRVKNQ